MKILIDIGHPAHVHLFRFFTRRSIENGDQILFTYRNREHVQHLLSVFGFRSVCFGPHYIGTFGKMKGLLQYDWHMLKTCLSFKPDILLSHGSMYAAQISRIIRKPHISFEDTFNMEQIRLYLPFTDVVLTGDYEHRALGPKEIRYPGYHELAYLHPGVFTPDPGVKELLGVSNDEPYGIVRFVAWNASHDLGHTGMTLSNKLRLIETLSSSLKVFVSSEESLPKTMEQYQIKLPPHKMHDALAYARLFVGESATMASECAVLGTPAIFLNDTQFGSISEQQKFGLVYQYPESADGQKFAINKALEIASENHVKAISESCRNNMLASKIDLTDFLFWFVHEYPDSVRQVRSSAFRFRTTSY